MFFKQLITGFLMACADSVPGVSGGTIAYIMGLYDKFITSIYNLTKKDKRKDAIKFLSVIAIAWIVGFIFAITLITNLIEGHLYDLSSLFLGFIIVSIIITFRNEKTLILENKNKIVFTIIGLLIVIVVAYLGTTLTPATGEQALSILNYIQLFFAGFVAICCMLLPGISGSTMLLIFGVYYIVTEAVHDLFNFDFSALNILIPLGLGIVIGALVAVKVISYVFENYRAQTIYFINGLLIGSIYAIIVGPISEQGEALNTSNFNLIWFIIGMFVIITIDRVNIVLTKQNETIIDK